MSHVNLHEVQAETDRKNRIAQKSVSEAARWVDHWKNNYDRQDRCIFDSFPGACCDSALFVYRLDNLAATRTVADKSMNLLKIAIAQAETVKMQCAIDLDAAYARRDQAILQDALDKQGGWLTE